MVKSLAIEGVKRPIGYYENKDLPAQTFENGHRLVKTYENGHDGNGVEESENGARNGNGIRNSRKPEPRARRLSKEGPPARFFKKYLEVAPLAHAVWRTPEAVALSKTEMYTPLLDIGCGFGEFAEIFFDCEVEVGLDISPSELEQCSTRQKYGTLVLADAREPMRLEDNTFNTVISVSVLEHIQNVEKVFAQAYRVMKPGGTFIFTVPTSALNGMLFGPRILRALRLRSLADLYVRKYHEIFKHEIVIPKSGWLKIAEDAGFKVEQCAGTLTQKQIGMFELFLLPALPTRFFRKALKRRMLVNPRFRVQLFRRLFHGIVSDPKLTDANIIVVARKP